MTGAELEARVNAIHKGIYGGKSDPNRCVCAERERGPFADTPHRHYCEPPFACARCWCDAYVPAVVAASRHVIDAKPEDGL